MARARDMHLSRCCNLLLEESLCEIPTFDVLMSAAEKYKDVNFLVLCGHTHSEKVIKVADNLIVKTGKAEYYQSMIQEVISI